MRGVGAQGARRARAHPRQVRGAGARRRCSSRRAPRPRTSCRARVGRGQRRGEPRASSPTSSRSRRRYADEGPTLKRWQPRARGRAMRIRKRTCHLTIVLRHDPTLEAAPSATGRTPRRGAEARATRGDASAPRRTGKAVAPEAAAESEARRRPSEAPEAAPPQAPSRGRAGDGSGRGDPRRAAADEAPAAEADEAADAEDAGRRGRERRRADAEGGGGLDGPEDPSRRPPRRHHPRLEVRLVLRERLRRVPAEDIRIREHISASCRTPGSPTSTSARTSSGSRSTSTRRGPAS